MRFLNLDVPLDLETLKFVSDVRGSLYIPSNKLHGGVSLMTEGKRKRLRAKRKKRKK